MRRLVLVGAAVTALAVASTAWGATFHFRGSMTETGGAVHSSVKRLDGRYRSVSNFAIGDQSNGGVLMDCDESGSVNVYFGPSTGTWRVRADDTFRGTEPEYSPDDGIVVKGSFYHNDQRAKGTVNVNGDLDIGMGLEHCTSNGPTPWRAHRTS